MTDLMRFLSHVEKVPDGCWLWTAGLGRGGYGKFKVGGRGGRTVWAHRWHYEETVGLIPNGLQIDHLCRTRACVNPAHLEPVTCRENLLRGDTFQARNAAKTHCPRGHLLSGPNLMRLGTGGRSCKTCKRAQTASWRAQHLELSRSREHDYARRRRLQVAMEASA